MYTINKQFMRIQERSINMNLKKNDIIITKGKAFPLGVSCYSDNVQFSFAYDSNKKSRLLLYRKKDKKEAMSFELDDSYVTGDVISCVLRAPGLPDILTEEYEYMIEYDEKPYIDPYAARISGRERFGKKCDAVRCGFDLKEFEWNDEKRPCHSFDELIIYRIHVRGFTKDKSSEVKCRGTYEGVTEKISYLTELGINAVLFLPTYDFNEIMKQDDAYGIPHNISYSGALNDEEEETRINYWGYTEDCAYFAPKASYSSTPSSCNDSFKNMVKSLHNAGIEVFMDMHFGSDMPYSMISDCLRYWAYNYHIDGFKVNDSVVPQKLITMDKSLKSVKFITNYWDRSDSRNNLADCNDGSLINIRRFILGEEGQAEEYVRRYLCGNDGIRDIRYVADVNGFTLMDAVSYDRKHNEANNENGNDGTNYNYSSGYGEEGPTRKKKINEIRNTQIKNALLLLFVSQGTPMLLSGDEFGNSQKGNNNAYCQDNRVSWLDWKNAGKNTELLEFVKELISFRKKYISDKNNGSVTFHGTLPWKADYSPYSRAVGIMVNPPGIYVAVNMDRHDEEFRLPAPDKGTNWKQCLGSRMCGEAGIENEQYVCNIPAHTVVVFICE